MSDPCPELRDFYFKVHLEGSEELVSFELLNLRYEDVTGYHIRHAVAERSGLNSDDLVILFHGLFDEGVLEDHMRIQEETVMESDAVFTLKFKDDNEQPMKVIPKEGVKLTSEKDDDVPVVDVLPPLLPPVEHAYTLGGHSSTTLGHTATTICNVVDELFPSNTDQQYSEVVTSVRGKVVVPDSSTTKNHAVYPFVFRAGGEDMKTMWYAELRERLAASIHPVSLGSRDLYQLAIKALDGEPSTPVAWELTISMSCRP